MEPFDFDEIYQQIESLDVAVSFVLEDGFEPLRAKLAEVIDANRRGTTLAVNMLKAQSAVREEITMHEAAYNVTGRVEDRERAKQARAVALSLKDAATALNMRLRRLRYLPHDIKLYARILEGALRVEGANTPAPQGGRAPALPTTTDPFDM